MNRIANVTHRIFYDNKMLLVFSFIAAILIWLIVAISLSPTDTALIENVPVEINLNNSVPAQFGLEVFGNTDYTVDVEITGKRYAVNSFAVNKNSVKVIAQTAYVDSAGKHTLMLKVSKTNDSDEFDIAAISEDYIEVYFDVPVERDFPIEAKLDIKNDLTAEGYIAADPVLSSSIVTVTGPETEVNSISKVYAEIAIDKPLSQTKTEAAEINAYNENGGTAHYLTYNYDNSDVTITVPVYLVVDKPTAVSFKNSPSNYHSKPFDYTISPAFVNAGVQGATDPDEIENVVIRTIDFDELKPGVNTFTVAPETIQNIYFIDKVEEFKITVNVTGCDTRKISVTQDNITYTGAPEGYSVKAVTQGVGTVTLVGPAASLEKINAEDITVSVDLSSADLQLTTQEFAAKLSVKGSNDCWVYGTYSIVIGE